MELKQQNLFRRNVDNYINYLKDNINNEDSFAQQIKLYTSKLGLFVVTDTISEGNLIFTVFVTDSIRFRRNHIQRKWNHGVDPTYINGLIFDQNFDIISILNRFIEKHKNIKHYARIKHSTYKGLYNKIKKGCYQYMKVSDGTTVSLYYYKNRWRLSSKKCHDISNTKRFDISFGNAFYNSMSDENKEEMGAKFEKNTLSFDKLNKNHIHTFGFSSYLLNQNNSKDKDTVWILRSIDRNIFEEIDNPFKSIEHQKVYKINQDKSLYTIASNTPNGIIISSIDNVSPPFIIKNNKLLKKEVTYYMKEDSNKYKVLVSSVEELNESKNNSTISKQANDLKIQIYKYIKKNMRDIIDVYKKRKGINFNIQTSNKNINLIRDIGRNCNLNCKAVSVERNIYKYIITQKNICMKIMNS